MSSQIDNSNINAGYPVAGQDNDSQGFRDNFAAIKENFTRAKTELTDLQSKVVLKAALTGDTLANDLGGSRISNGNYLNFHGTAFSQTVFVIILPQLKKILHEQKQNLLICKVKLY